MTKNLAKKFNIVVLLIENIRMINTPTNLYSLVVFGVIGIDYLGEMFNKVVTAAASGQELKLVFLSTVFPSHMSISSYRIRAEHYERETVGSRRLHTPTTVIQTNDNKTKLHFG